MTTVVPPLPLTMNSTFVIPKESDALATTYNFPRKDLARCWLQRDVLVACGLWEGSVWNTKHVCGGEEGKLKDTGIMRHRPNKIRRFVTGTQACNEAVGSPLDVGEHDGIRHFVVAVLTGI